MQSLLHLLGRLLLALPFLVFGVGHFQHADRMVGLVPSWLPDDRAWVFATGACLVAAGVAFVLRRFDRLAGFLLAVLLLAFVFTVHLPAWRAPVSDTVSGALLKNMAFAGMLKDAGLAGAALIVATMPRRR
ncbi:MAG: DoxX family membrane protein [Deltaproteobacteria bacterium]|nr:DoxX family membrane protein [Deltaproteobacteria bacterium]